MLNFILGSISTYFLINLYIAISNFNLLDTEYIGILRMGKFKLVVDLLFGVFLANGFYKIATKTMSKSTVEKILEEKWIINYL